MLSMSLHVLGSVAALLIAAAVYLAERGPIIGLRWLEFLERLDSYRRRRR